MCVIKYATRSSRSSKKSILRSGYHDRNCETLKETEEIFQYGIHRFQEEILDCEEDELLIHISKTLATPAPYTFLYETLNLSVLTKSRSVTF